MATETPEPSRRPPRRRGPFRRLRYWFYDKLPYWIILVLLVLLVVFFFFDRVFVVVGPGHGGVLYRLWTGTVTDYVYPERMHMVLPINKMTVYDARVQIIRHDMDVLTNKGLPITLKIAVRFQPIYELLGRLHQDVGPDYPDKIILPQIEGVLRKRIGQLSPEDVYTNKAGVLSDILAQAIEEVGQKFVIVDAVIIRSVTLPPAVKEAIDEKLVREQEYLAYDYILKKEEQEAERKRIEAGGIHEYNERVSKSLDEKLIRWRGVQATMEMAKSDNAKVVVIGAGEEGLPIILGNQ